MPRKPMVTKTIKTTTATAICMDLTTEKTYEVVYILSGHYKNSSHVQMALEQELNDTGHKVVHVKDYVEQSALFGMSEQKFVTYATPLPPRK